ncbi:hypothetical protein HA872_004076 [Salmonella enterica]|nr:hypothetical protein [Salmonella enterica]
MWQPDHSGKILSRKTGAVQYGWIVRAGMRGNDWKEELRDYGVTWQTIENIQKVLDAGFDAVHFDCDAELVDGLPAWDW